jgi:hypothetical protein
MISRPTQDVISGLYARRISLLLDDNALIRYRWYISPISPGLVFQCWRPSTTGEYFTHDYVFHHIVSARRFASLFLPQLSPPQDRVLVTTGFEIKAAVRSILLTTMDC